MQKLIFPRLSVFSYDPRWDELRLGAEPALYYMGEGSCFFVDQNPQGDRIMAPVTEIAVEQDGGALRLGWAEKNDAVEYLVVAGCHFDRLIIGLANELEKGAGLQRGAADDKIDVTCEGGLISTCYITRVFDGDAPRSLRIVRSDGAYQLVIPSPRYRSRIATISMDGTELLIECMDGKLIRRAIALPDPIMDFLSSVIDEM